MNKIMKGLAGILAGFMLVGTSALAETPAAVMETFTGDSDISAYVKGIDSDSEINVQIATTEADNVEVQKISELERPMQTLVMIDNSLSISMENRDKISEFLQNLVSDRMSGEEICIAVFSEGLTKLTEYTNDYGILKRAAENISYEYQDTYLTDVLYDLLTEEYQNSEDDLYRRIIVVADGFDNKYIGYTKDEFYALLKDVHIPIYTVGSLDEENKEGLENLFSLSRMTSAKEFLLDETEDVWEITEELKTDRDIAKLVITPPEEMLDGSKKTLQITMSDETSLTTEVTMPQQVSSAGDEGQATAGAEQKPAGSLLLTVGLAVIVVLVAGIIFAWKKKKGKTNPGGFDASTLDRQLQNDGNPADKTEILGSFQKSDKDDRTVPIWEQEKNYQVVLTDVNALARSYQMPITNSLVIGRKKGECDIVLDYEKSVSGKHCEISVKNGKFYVRDLQASNGTFLNENRVMTETEIVSGNILRLGRVELRFEVK